MAYDAPFRLGDLANKDGVLVHSLDDLAAGKLLALFTRAEARDFIDVYFLVNDKGYTIERLITIASKKDPGLDPYYLALAFEKVERLPDNLSGFHLTLLKDIDITELKTFFKNEAVKILQQRV